MLHSAVQRLRRPAGQLLGRLNERLTSFGERHHLDWLTYNPLQMRVYHRVGRIDAPGVIDAIVSLFPAVRAVVDVGSGSGAFAAEARRRGLDVDACERSLWGRLYAHAQHVSCHRFDLRRDPPASFGRAFDLAYSFEVAEHLPAILADRFVDFLSRLAPTTVFTAAHPGQGGLAHLNEQPLAYWIELFAVRGMSYDDDLTVRLRTEVEARNVPSTWFMENLAVFRRSA